MRDLQESPADNSGNAAPVSAGSEEGAPLSPGPTFEPARSGGESTQAPVGTAANSSPENPSEAEDAPVRANGSELQTTSAATVAPGEKPEPTEPPREILAEYLPLYALNPDFYGWLQIDDTPINYPVMVSEEDAEHYLHRDFYGEYSYSGTPFLEPGCSEEGKYAIIYAHHMKDGSMFGTLPGYAKREYWEEHPIIRFDSLYEQREYQVVAAFLSRVYGEREKDVFRYYEYTDLSDPELFEAYMDGVRAAALYDTEIEVEYGDELLALSTCNYHTSNGRFVVVAKRIEGEEVGSREQGVGSRQ